MTGGFPEIPGTGQAKRKFRTPSPAGRAKAGTPIDFLCSVRQSVAGVVFAARAASEVMAACGLRRGSHHRSTHSLADSARAEASCARGRRRRPHAPSRLFVGRIPERGGNLQLSNVGLLSDWGWSPCQGFCFSTTAQSSRADYAGYSTSPLYAKPYRLYFLSIAIFCARSDEDIDYMIISLAERTVPRANQELRVM